LDTTLNILKALSDRNRLRTVLALHEVEELCACQITELLAVSGATASRHLAQLVRAGILQSRKEGRWVYYRLRLSEENEPVLRWATASAAGTPEAVADLRAISGIVACDPEEICRRQRGEECCPSK
jgi:ArsR family transcriptional regulator